MAAALLSWLSGRRTRVLLTLVATILVVAAIAVVTSGGDDGDATALVATGPDDPSADGSTTSSSSALLEPPPTSSTTAAPTTAPPPPPSTVAPAPAPGEPVTVATDPAGAWSLVRYDPSGGACLELRVQTFRSERVLCGAAPAAAGAVVGDLITFNTPIGRAVVAIVEPRVEAWGASPYQQQHGPAFRDPTPSRAAYGYAAGTSRTIGSTNSSMQLFFSVGENVIARTSFALGDKTVSPGQSLTTTDKPYGTWPGYRRAGTTGFYYGGNEEFGFFDGGGRCVLYRRLGGEPEAMLFEVCAPRSDRPIASATIVPAGPPYANPMLVVVADGLQVVRWTCTTSAGASCGASAPSSGGFFSRETQLAADPAGSGRQLIGSFPGWAADLAGAKDVTVTLFAAGDKPVGKVTIPVP
jgi:hypothetical protein